MSENLPHKPTRRTLFIVLLIGATYMLALTAMVMPLITPITAATMQIGLVATQDIQAPRAISFQSNLLTEEQRDLAANQVLPVYTSADTTIARNQLEKLRAALAYISAVRADTYSTTEQKIIDLAALENIQMSEELSQSILNLNDPRWQAVQQEAIVVLEQVMRNTIRQDHLSELNANLPAMVSLSLSEEQAEIVAKLVRAFVAPNSFYSEELTDAARLIARQDVTPITRSYKAGETIVQRGKVITASDYEALQVLGLVQPQYNWKEFLSIALLTLVSLIFTSLYLRQQKEINQEHRTLILIALLFLVFLFLARVIIPGHTLVPYMFPLAAFGMTVSVLVGSQPAIVISLILALLTAYDLPYALELMTFYALSSFFGILVLGKGVRVMSFILAGAAVAVAGILVALIFRIPQPTTDLIGLASIGGASLINGFVSAGLTILLQYFLAQLLGTTTALQLLEISRPDHPLLQYLLRNAPGTYQHSLQVANLAEQAADYIGADGLLTRVGALYHDIGKAKKPVYFIENQVTNLDNPHDLLDPEISAQVVISHVIEGLELAKKYHLPKRIQDFIVEHHGLMITRYQFAKAVEALGGDQGKIDAELFRYPGPKPSSKETAILMLADGCEARVRAERPKDEAELRETIKSVIDHRLNLGELDNTNLTLKNLSDLVDSFTTTLRGMYHPRIEYPKLEKEEMQHPTVRPPLAIQTQSSTQESRDNKIDNDET